MSRSEQNWDLLNEKTLSITPYTGFLGLFSDFPTIDSHLPTVFSLKNKLKIAHMTKSKTYWKTE
jgi:hypothetical protein